MPVARARLACHHQRSGIPVRCTGPGAHALSFALVTGDQLVTGIVNEHLRAKTALECPFDGWPAGLLRWLEIHQDLKCLALRGEKDLDPCLFHRPCVEACHQLNLGRCPVDLLLCGFVALWFLGAAPPLPWSSAGQCSSWVAVLVLPAWRTGLVLGRSLQGRPQSWHSYSAVPGSWRSFLLCSASLMLLE